MTLSAIKRYASSLSSSGALGTSVTPWDHAWSANAERRHLAPGTRAVVFEYFAKASAAWDALQQQIRDEANRKHKEAAVRQPRTGGGKFGTVGASIDAQADTRPKSQKNKTSTKKAKAAGVSEKTIERAQALVENRPDLANEVQTGEMTLNEATREMKRDEIRQRLEDVAAREVEAPTGLYDVVVIDPPWKHGNSGLAFAVAIVPRLRAPNIGSVRDRDQQENNRDEDNREGPHCLSSFSAKGSRHMPPAWLNAAPDAHHPTAIHPRFLLAFRPASGTSIGSGGRSFKDTSSSGKRSTCGFRSIRRKRWPNR